MTQTMTKTYLGDFDPETFNAVDYLRQRIPTYETMDAATQKAARITLTRDDPLLFAILYFRKTLAAGGSGITFADMHADFCRIARRFRQQLDPVNPLRLAFIAPRRAGKSSWLFKILSSWVACHGHRKFFYVVTATGAQAQLWITNFKLVIEENDLIREDYPGLCVPRKRESTGRAFSDSSNIYMSDSGFTIGAQAADSNRLGLNLDDERPDFILFDDIESPNDTIYELNKRLTNVIDGAIPMGQEGATIVFVGTVHKAGSIMDQFREHALVPDRPSWIEALSVRVKHYKPFVNPETHEESTHSFPGCRSFWPGRHKLTKLLREEGSRFFATHYTNEPVPESGDYWRENDIKFGTINPSEPCVTVLSLDPAVKSKKKSDFTALSIIRYAPRLDLFEVLYGRAFKLNPGLEMPQYVGNLLATWSEVVAIIVEDNQGGDLWQQFYGSIPGVQLWQVGNYGMSKTQRAATVLRLYQTGHVVHSTESGADTKQLESEMYGFPNNLHDDLPDSVCTGVLTLRKKYAQAPQDDLETSYV